MKRIFAVLVLAVLAAGCSKSSSTSSEQATSAATAQAVPADAASDTAAAASAAPVANDAGSGGAYKLIVLPVYPGSTKAPGDGTNVNEGSDNLQAQYYYSHDPADTVAAWYKAHLPSDWDSVLGEPGKKMAGVFTSPNQGDNDGQDVSVTGGDPSLETEILLSTKTPTR